MALPVQKITADKPMEARHRINDAHAESPMGIALKKSEVEDHMESSIDVLTNAVRAIGTKLDELSQKVDSHNEKFGEIDKRFDAVDTRFDRLDQRVDRLEQRYERLDAKIDTVGAQLTSAIRSVSERIDRQWESLNAHQREMKVMIEKFMESRDGGKRWWILMAVMLLGMLAVVGVMALAFKWM